MVWVEHISRITNIISIPRPPPPREALSITGVQVLTATFQAETLLPMARIISEDGPININPAVTQALIKFGFSDKKAHTPDEPHKPQ